MTSMSSIMRRAARQAYFAVPRRNGSDWVNRRWVDKVRSESNVNSVDEPPTAPLPEEHEIEGKADFSNFISRYDDVSKNEALLGLGTLLAFYYGTFMYAKNRAESQPPKFHVREMPTMYSDIPTLDKDSDPGPFGL